MIQIFQIDNQSINQNRLDQVNFLIYHQRDQWAIPGIFLQKEFELFWYSLLQFFLNLIELYQGLNRRNGVDIYIPQHFLGFLEFWIQIK